MSQGLPFVQAVLAYLDAKVALLDGLPAGQQPGKVNVPAETIATFFRVRATAGLLIQSMACTPARLLCC